MSDHDATLRRWLAEHRGILIRISRAYAVDAADEEDLFQEILMALWRSIPAFRGDAKPSTWIFQVGLNVALSRRRAAARRPAHDSLEVTRERTELSTDGEAAAMQRMQWQAVLQALRSLDPVDRAVLLLALEGATQQDIADVIGISPTYAGVKLHRARRRLATALER